MQKYLSGKPESVVHLYRQFEHLALALGEVEIAPAKTRIGFQNRRIFAAVNRISQQYLDVHIVTSQLIKSLRVRRVEGIDQDCYVNHLRIQSLDELDEELLDWLRQGYEWGG